MDPVKLKKVQNKLKQQDTRASYKQWPTANDCVRIRDYLLLRVRPHTLSLKTPTGGGNEREFLVKEDTLDRDHIFIKPVHGLVPCGWFTLDDIEKQLEAHNVVVVPGTNEQQ